MKIFLYFAPSLNGFIAHSDGSEEFIPESAWELSEKLAAQTDAVIVGRKTLENVESWNDPRYSFDTLQVKERVVISTNLDYQPKEGWIHAVSPEDAIAKLEAKGCQSAYLAGGSQLAGAFLNRHLVDAFYVFVQPWLVSEGVGTITGLTTDIHMELLSSEVKESGEVLLEYHINM